ncbi:MAG: hypothetical protein SF028_02625 [Candidatus Sumerlaeia bacterium]|nr:hypothetical protein [Candidatus Sumerlaeia bacterium]
MATPRKVRTRVFAAACAAALAAHAHAQTEAAVDWSDPAWKHAWAEDVPAQISSARTLAAFRKNLVALEDSGAEPRWAVLELTATGTSGTLELLPAPGLRAGERAVRLAVVPPQNAYYLLASRESGGASLYRAPALADGRPGEATALPLPEGSERLVDLAAGPELLVLLAREPQGRPPATSLFASAWTGSEAAEWIATMPAPVALDGAALLLQHNRATLVGGLEQGGRPARLPLGTEIRYPNAGSWEREPLPLPTAPGRAQGLVLGSYAVLADESPEGALRILVAGDLGDGAFRSFRAADTDYPAPEGAVLVNDSVHAQLLVVGGELADGAPHARIAAFPYPAGATLRRPTAEDLRREELDRAMEMLDPKPRADAERIAAERGQYLLTMIPGEGPGGEELLLRLARGGSIRPYWSALTPFLATGAEAQEDSARFGVQATPAFILHTQGGTVLRRIEGRVPSAQEWFDLTAPSRDPAGTHPDPAS